MQENKEIVTKYHQIKESLKNDIELVVVSKTHPIEKIKAIYDLGQRTFGENRVQELMEKQPNLPEDIKWNLIGHLQTNKVKFIAEFIDTIQSVDSEKLLAEIDRQAAKFDRTVNILLQVKIAEEDTKYGLEISETKEIFLDFLNGKYQNVKITGLMGMATFTKDEDQVRKEFDVLKQLFDQLSTKKPLETLSMGMSDDYELAIDCGANSVRIGSAIFGRRN